MGIILLHQQMGRHSLAIQKISGEDKLNLVHCTSNENKYLSFGTGLKNLNLWCVSQLQNLIMKVGDKCIYAIICNIKSGVHSKNIVKRRFFP